MVIDLVLGVSIHPLMRMETKQLETNVQSNRRNFLGGVAAGGFLGLAQPAAAGKVADPTRKVLMVFQHGGLSQLESWDPKPNTRHGGPFRSIATTIPGTHISELLPHTAKQVHHLAILRGLNTGDANHDSARVTMLTGWRQGVRGGQYPSYGSVFNHLEGSKHTQPSFVVLAQRDQWHLKPLVDASYLGARFAPIVSFDEMPPLNVAPPPELTSARQKRREQLREQLNEDFSTSRGQPSGKSKVAAGRSGRGQAAFENSFVKARHLIRQRKMFDISKVSERDKQRYGQHAFGRRCLIARQLLEQNVSIVKLNHGNYDTHFENFNHHLHRLEEFDRPFAALIEDLASRGLLNDTLVIVTGEFGRTPGINSSIGRDHWANAWSIALAGHGIKPGVVYGKTNATGTAVSAGQVGFGDVFHTIYSALKLDPERELHNGEQPLKMFEQVGKPIKQVLA